MNQKSVDNFHFTINWIYSRKQLSKAHQLIITRYLVVDRKIIFFSTIYENIIYITNAKIIKLYATLRFSMCRAKTNESVEYWLLWGKENGIKVIKWPELPEKRKHTIKNENLDKGYYFPLMINLI